MKIVKLKDISVNNRGYYGIGASAVDYDANKYTYLRITDINDDGSLNKNDLMSVDDEKANQYLLQKNDIVFARTGASTGRNYFYDGEIENMVYAGFLIKFSLNSDLVNPRYIKYYCLSQKYKNWILSSITGSTRPNINEKQLADMPIELPERKYQDKVVKIIDALTNKIKLNNEINNNLQEISKQLYKRWFIDFEFSNEDGNPYKSSGGKMIDSELGKIPEGWNIYKLDELFYHISPGTNYQPKRVETGIPFLNVKNINNGYIDTTDSKYITEEDYKKVHKSWKPEENDLLLSRIGTIGLVTTIRQEDLPLAVHYNFIVLKTNSLPFEFAYFLLQSDDFQSKYRYCVKQSVQEYVTVEDAKNIKVALPKNNVLYDIFIKNYERILNIQRENKNLEQLRDTLLPKLMNGEIDLDNIEI